MGIGVCVCSCAPAISGAVRVALSFQKWGSAGGGALSCPFPWDGNLWSCVGSGARSIPGVAGLCWRGWGLSRLALGHPSPGSHHCCRAGASGLCPCAVPRLIIPGRRRRAAVPSSLRERCLPERILLRPPASLLRRLCVPGLLPPLPVPCWPQPGCCPAFRVPCPVSLLQGDAKTSITSTSVPGGISSVPFAYFSS